MNVIVGMMVVLGSVVGGFMIEGGALGVLIQPIELLIILGSALGAFIVSNPAKVIKKAVGGLGLLLKGSKYSKALYMDALALMYELLTKARKEGLMSLEADVEDPEKSPIFGKYPTIQHDHHAVDFITDYLRMVVGGSMNAFELENLMDIELETHHEEAHQPPAAIARIGDGLPGFGIVAAVLGVVITMGHLDGSPDEIGGHVAVALIGTLLGILFAYGFFGPFSTMMEHIGRDESQFYKVLKTTIVASLQGYAPLVAVEFGRKAIFSNERPSFKELEEHVKSRAAGK
jgi:chemotaxis protein MotA